MNQHRCDTCRTSFDCKTLNTALLVLKAHEDEITDPELKHRYEAIVEILEKSDWHFPDGSQSCRYATMPREIQALTTELVKLWQASHWANRSEGAARLYQEEVHQD